MVRRWLDAIFADGIEDPVPSAVDDALARFHGSPRFRKALMWYTIRLGVNTFLDQMFDVESAWRQGEVRSPARALHSRIRRIYREIFHTASPETRN